MRVLAVLLTAAVSLASIAQSADDWPRFRGPAGRGVVAEVAGVPTEWSPEANLAWKTPLPGPGASSPIIVDGLPNGVARA